MAYNLNNKVVGSLDDDGMAWEEKLKKYAMDRNSGAADYARSSAKLNLQKSLGDTSGMAATQKWMSQIDDASGGLMSRANNPVAESTDKYKSLMEAAANRKAFDPASDQQYQAQLAAARAAAMQGAQTATNNAMVGLGARGIGNSSVAVDRANQINQQANTRLQTEITPQIMQQAYQRYMGDQQLAQQDIGNFGNFVNTINGQQQQGLDNAYRNDTLAETKKQNNLDAALRVGQQTGTFVQPKEDYNLLYNQDAPLNMIGKQFQSGEDQRAFENDLSNKNFVLNERQTNASIANSSAANVRAASADARAAGNQELGNLYDIWDHTGRAPAGIPGVAEGTPLASKGQSSQSTGGLTANQLLTSIRDMYTEPVYTGTGLLQKKDGEKMTTDPAKREQMFLNVVDAGLDEKETDQVLSALGMSRKEIDGYLKKYGSQ